MRKLREEKTPPMRFTRTAVPSMLAFSILLLCMGLSPAAAQTQVTTPTEQFGQPIGADYFLTDYEQLSEYWETLAGESDRMVLDTIGTTEEGRAQLMAIVTSPENHANLDRYKAISRRLALAEDVDQEEAVRLSREGKAVVWIDGGLHSTEVLGAQQLIETVYQMVSGTDAETTRFLDDVIILFVHANPDGHQLVTDWYMRNEDPQERSTSGLPRLYQKYAGHDNNRDFYMAALAETENMNRVAYREWFPQIIYNHHQTGPTGTVMFAPPFRGPANYHLDPLILLGIDLVGAAMHTRFVREDKPGTTMRSGASYSTWWNGGLRTTPYYHNMIGLLTETIGSPTPMRIPFVPDRHLQTNDMPYPIEPQEWHFRQSVEYSLTANRAVLDVASRFSENLLYNIWRMGRNSIERGSRDHWTVYPHELDAIRDSIGSNRGSDEEFERFMRDPDERDARAYIMPREQDDYPTAAKFANALIRGGVFVDSATAPFTVDGVEYDEGTLVVRAAQAFRPQVLDMFEPQDHPDDIPYPGAAPIAPYDNAGWTLAYQMGVEFDRVLDGLPENLPLVRLEDFVEPEGYVSPAAEGTAGWLVSHTLNDAFTAANRVLEAGGEVEWLLEPVQAAEVGSEGGRDWWPAGTFFVPSGGEVDDVVQATAGERGLGVAFHSVATRPDRRALRLDRPLRIGLVDEYGGSMTSGWTRLILEQFEFPFEVVYAGDLDAGNLQDRFDALIFVPGMIPEEDDPRRLERQPAPEEIPAEYRDRLGVITVEQTVPEILEFAEAGGTVITIGSSSVLAEHADLPIGDYLVELDEEGVEQPLPSEEYYVPGSVLYTRVDTSNPLAHGMRERVNVLFRRSPVFDLEEGAAAAGVRRVGWYDTDTPLRSGWAWGQDHLEGGASIVEADLGQGKLFLFGPEIIFRAQAHEAFKLLFNALYYGTAEGAEVE